MIRETKIKDLENGSVVLHSRKDGELGEVSIDSVVEKLCEEVRMKKL
jgi:threonyl-tRNA synthetase